MTANSLQPRFKNPFDLTVNQAIGIGGGNSRQAVWVKQQKLKKVKIEGKWLVHIHSGNKQKNVPARYEINYNLLIPENLAAPEFTTHQSKKPDTYVDRNVDTSATDPLTILRSRSEENKKNNNICNINKLSIEDLPETKNDDSFSASQGEASGTLNDVQILQAALLDKWRPQLMDALPPYPACQSALQSFPIDVLKDAIERAPAILKSDNGKVTPRYVLNWIMKIAAHPQWYTTQEATKSKERSLEQQLKDCQESLAWLRGHENWEKNKHLDYERGEEQRYLAEIERLRGEINAKRGG
jgi:hypothetical protein